MSETDTKWTPEEDSKMILVMELCRSYGMDNETTAQIINLTVDIFCARLNAIVSQRAAQILEKQKNIPVADASQVVAEQQVVDPEYVWDSVVDLTPPINKDTL